MCTISSGIGKWKNGKIVIKRRKQNHVMGKRNAGSLTTDQSQYQRKKNIRNRKSDDVIEYYERKTHNSHTKY